ncbi:MAG: PHP domain-containing protein [Selenomonadaceae bacterium]|nr:PHP domain-containing protein [Selenomonadaceae bacterium]
MPSDLHMHTSFSDGTLSPEELVAAAKEVGLSYMAITDHDTIDGVSQLYEDGHYPSRGLRLIPGIEFSAHHPVHDIHILGYNIDIYHRELADKLTEITESRWTRFTAMVAKLQGLGYQLKESEVLAVADTSRAISRSHIARVLVKKNFFPSVREAFAVLLEKGKPAYVPHYRPEAAEIVSLIKKAGGLPVLAHPKLVQNEDLVEYLCRDIGIEGLEVFYPQHDEADVVRYLHLAEKYHLQITGGSDFHGFTSRHPTELGVFTIDDSYAEKLYRPL